MFVPSIPSHSSLYAPDTVVVIRVKGSSNYFYDEIPYFQNSFVDVALVVAVKVMLILGGLYQGDIAMFFDKIDVIGVTLDLRFLEKRNSRGSNLKLGGGHGFAM